MTLAPPVIERRGQLLVVRDDLIEGGTKTRALPTLMDGPAREFVYASPAYGHAQIAVALVAQQLGKRATIFTAQRKALHRNTAEARRYGAKIVLVPSGYLNVVKARARSYAAISGAHVLPFGLDCPAFIDALARIALGLPIEPAEVWSVAGTGVLTRALQQAWPDAVFHAVRIGGACDVGRATLHQAPESFEQDAAQPPPFPSASNYDAKAWRFIGAHASAEAVFWNVAA